MLLERQMKNNDLRKERFYELVDSGTSIDLARHLAGFKTGEFKRLRRADSDLDLLVREKAKSDVRICMPGRACTII